METRLKEIITYALRLKATDIHFTYKDVMLIECRVQKKFYLIPIKEKDEQLFSYLQYLSDMDLSSFAKPQSGAFTMELDDKTFAFRFALLQTHQQKSGVLRIMNFQKALTLQELILKGEQRKLIKEWCTYENGLLLIGGPTGDAQLQLPIIIKK
ncbi:MAG: Flp pilus assembly complex ATPase component TadA [Erysipelotrichaceae bacterium]|nr:Flp pilus assembly complex ATPase component TadA [Erysipelotrichaceae bacterium]